MFGWVKWVRKVPMLLRIKGQIGKARNNGLFKSKKFWMTIIGGLIASFGEAIGLSPDAVKEIVAMLMTYLVGQGIADHGKEKARAEKG